LTKSKKVLKVKAGVDTILKLFVQLSRDVVIAQRPTLAALAEDSDDGAANFDVPGEPDFR
jgi:hypothetical protein